MIESIMYLGIGFLAASISVLAVVPIVHTRAVRLTTRQLADTMPSSVAEIAADKDLLRAEFAMSTRTLEMKVDQLKGKGANQLLELGKSGSHPDRAPGRGLQRTDCGGGSPLCADRRGGERRAGVVREGSGSRQAHRRVERALNVRRYTGEGACCTQGLRWRHQRAPRRSQQRIAGGGRPTRCRAART